MNDDQIQVPVTLTRQEAADVDATAQKQGVSTPDFLSYCVRAIAFGVNHAMRMLPRQGQAGTSEERD
jgi:hypothetical protein